MMRHRLRVAEAAAWLAVARMLIAIVPFRRWRSLLGQTVAHDHPVPRPDADDADIALRACCAAIRRATARLPGSICLPQAIALQWMLARRHIPSLLTIGFLPGASPGTRDGLHAWVTTWRGIAIGDSKDRHVPVFSVSSHVETHG